MYRTHMLLHSPAFSVADDFHQHTLRAPYHGHHPFVSSARSISLSLYAPGLRGGTRLIIND